VARIVIQISDASRDDLVRLASRDYRDPRMQAKYLLEQAIRDRSAGTRPADNPATDPRPTAAVEAVKT
jgi:hypothetical protein